MGKGLINIRALARYIIKERKLETTLDAVISAIRRYEMKSEEKLFENAYDIITKTIAISTKTPLASISLIKDTEVQGLLPELFSLIHYDQGDVLRIIQADESIKILLDDKNFENAKNLFPEEKIIQIKRNLGEINSHMHPDGEHVLGITAVTLNELAINGIQVQETMSCFPEILWFVNEKDMLQAYNILYKLWNPKAKEEYQRKVDYFVKTYLKEHDAEDATPEKISKFLEDEIEALPHYDKWNYEEDVLGRILNHGGYKEMTREKTHKDK